MLQEFTQGIKDRMQDMLRDAHTAIPGRIVSFDADKCEASILPYGKYKKPDGSMMDYPQLNEVPIYVMQGSGQTASVVFPIKSGDECVILFSEQALDGWRKKSESGTDLRFDLSNAVAVVGLFSKPNPLVKEACADNSLIIEKDGERVRLKKGESYIRDTAGQSITLTPEAITIVANNAVVNVGGNAKVDVSGNASLQTGGSVSVNAGGNMSIVGNVSIAGTLSIASSTPTGMALSASGSISTTGDISTDGNVTASGDVTAGSISLQNHTHRYNPGGGSPTPTQPPE